MKWELREADWEKLENVLDSKLDESHVVELFKKIVRFYFFQILADGGQTWERHRSHLFKIIDCAARLKDLLDQTNDPDLSVGAVSALNVDLAENLDPDDLLVPRYRVFADVPEYEDYIQNGTYPLTDFVAEHALPLIQQGSSLVVFQISDIRRMLSALQKAANRVREDYDDQASAIVRRASAYDVFLNDVYEWAKHCKLKTSTMRKDRSAGPLARFIFELDGTFPEQFRQFPASAEAVAKALQRARRALAGQKGTRPET